MGVRSSKLLGKGRNSTQSKTWTLKSLEENVFKTVSQLENNKADEILTVLN